MKRMSAALMAGIAAATSAAAAAVGAASPRILNTREAYQLGMRMRGGQPWRGTAGMAYGSKVRGNRNVQRAAAKTRNQARHRKACRG